MINQEILNYIKQQLQQGAPPETIKNLLRTNGWTDIDLAQAFASLATQPSNNIPASVPASNNIPRPKGVKVISVLYFLVSLMALGFSGLAIFGANFFAQYPEIGFFSKFFVIGGVIFIILSIFGILIGIGLWRYRNWARWTTIIIFLIGIVLSFLSVLGGNISNNIFNLVISAIICGYLFFNPKVKFAFQPQRGVAVLNKKLLWTSLILFIVLVGGASVFASKNASNFPSTATYPIDLPVATSTTPLVDLSASSSLPTSTPEGMSQALGPKESWIKMEKEADNIKSSDISPHGPILC
jgi:hypothetical protein